MVGINKIKSSLVIFMERYDRRRKKIEGRERER